MIPKLVQALLILLVCSACTQQKELSLLDHGLPLRLVVPADVRVTEMNLIVTRDIDIKGSGFHLQLLVQKPLSANPDSILLRQREAVRGHSDFREILDENTAGFFYRCETPAGDTYYNFRQVLLLDSVYVLFRAHPRSILARTQVAGMYEAAQQAAPIR